MDYLNELTRLQVVRRGHFLRSSGRHTACYVQCARLFEHAETAEQIPLDTIG